MTVTAAGLSILPTADGKVVVALHDLDGEVIASATLSPANAVTVNERLSAACHRALAGPTASGAVH